ncbi:probable metallophosphoesterase [gamma proteobacterium HdN1]|nr:probable metallophosphoesterase [gamma proteobacterium HdN1]
MHEWFTKFTQSVTTNRRRNKTPFTGLWYRMQLPLRRYPSTLTVHRSLPTNLAGRDFFVGDTHGHYTHLFQQLARAGFDASVDRLIATGDLIDRGDQSMAMLELLEQPWFFSVLGNHEIMFLEGMLNEDRHYIAMQLQNGGQWLQTFNEDDLRHQARQIAKYCPLAITVETTGYKVGICHTDPLLENWSAMQKLPLKAFYPELACLWSRSRYQKARTGKPQKPIANIDIVISGHVACDAPTWAANQVFIDTFHRGGALTVSTLSALLNPTTIA